MHHATQILQSRADKSLTGLTDLWGKDIFSADYTDRIEIIVDASHCADCTE